jgi:hypothetical protein
MIDKIEPHQTQDFVAELSSKQPNCPKAPVNTGVDISIRVDYASLIDKETQIQQADGEAVQHARELLLSGRLGSPERILAAAKNMARFGI